MYDWQPSYSSKKCLLAEILHDCSAVSIIHANIMILWAYTELTLYLYAMDDIAMYDITSRNSLHQQHSARSQAEKWGHGEKAPSSL